MIGSRNSEGGETPELGRSPRASRGGARHLPRGRRRRSFDPDGRPCRRMPSPVSGRLLRRRSGRGIPWRTRWLSPLPGSRSVPGQRRSPAAFAERRHPCPSIRSMKGRHPARSAEYRLGKRYSFSEPTRPSGTGRPAEPVPVETGGGLDFGRVDVTSLNPAQPEPNAGCETGSAAPGNPASGSRQPGGGQFVVILSKASWARAKGPESREKNPPHRQ